MAITKFYSPWMECEISSCDWSFSYPLNLLVSTDNSCPVENGSMKYVKVGCFNDKKDPPLRALKHLLFQDRDKQYKSTYSGRNISWKEWKTYLPEWVQSFRNSSDNNVVLIETVCLCGKKTILKKGMGCSNLTPCCHGLLPDLVRKKTIRTNSSDPRLLRSIMVRQIKRYTLVTDTSYLWSLILIIPEERTLKKQLWKTASSWSFKHLVHLWLSFFLDLSAAVRTPLSKTVKFSSRSNFMANVGPSGTVMTVTLNTGAATSVKIWSFKPARMIIPCRALGWNIPTMFMK